MDNDVTLPIRLENVSIVVTLKTDTGNYYYEYNHESPYKFFNAETVKALSLFLSTVGFDKKHNNNITVSTKVYATVD